MQQGPKRASISRLESVNRRCFRYRCALANVSDYLLLPTLGFPKQRAEFSNRNPERLAACRHDSLAGLLPKILGPTREQYVPLAPHSSTRCGKAKLIPEPGKRQCSLRTSL